MSKKQWHRILEAYAKKSRSAREAFRAKYSIGVIDYKEAMRFLKNLR